MPKAVLWLLFGIAGIIGCAVLAIAAIYVLMWWSARSQMSTMEDYIATCMSAKKRLPIAVEFEQLFRKKTDHFITHFGFNRYDGERTNTWNSEAHFNGRYQLTMQVEVTIDYDKNRITHAGDPEFYLCEHYRIDPENLSSKVRELARFGELEWRKLYKSGGDFSTIGITIQDDSPIPHFESMARAWREPRIPVTLLPSKSRPDSLGSSRDKSSNQSTDD